MVLYQDLYHNVLELDIHDGRHGLLLWAKQSWPEHHTQVGDGHQIVLVVIGHTVDEGARGKRERQRVSGFMFNPT